MVRKVNIRKTSDPRAHRSPWQVRWRTSDGRYPNRCFRTRSIATDYAAKIQAELNAEVIGSAHGLEWRELTDRFIEARRADRLADSTIKIYAEVAAEFGQINSYPLTTQITIRHIDRYKLELTANTPATINKKLRHLSAILNWAKKRGYLKSNPVPDSGKLREDKLIPRSLTPKQFNQLLDFCHDPQWRLLILLAVNGVGRKNSLVALNIDDIDFDNGTVRVYDQKQRQSRIAPVHPTTLKELTRYVTELPAGQKRLFTLRFHHTTWNLLLKKAKLPLIRFHDLRTCMSTWLKQAGVSDGVVTAIFGHSSPSVTTRHYTALDNVESKRTAVSKLPL